MANVTIGDLTAATAVADDDLFEIQNGAGNSRKVTGAQIKAYLAVYSFEASPSIPASSNFTLDNAGTASVSDVTGGMLLTAPAATDTIRFLRFTGTVSSYTSFTATLRAVPVKLTSTATDSCILLRNSANSKILLFGGYSSHANQLIQQWSAYSTFNATLINTAYPAVFMSWRRIVVGSGTIIFQCSPDGKQWFTVSTTTTATYISAIDQIGIGAIPVSGTAADTLFQSFSLV